jgi:hypothetical protein
MKEMALKRTVELTNAGGSNSKLSIGLGSGRQAVSAAPLESRPKKYQEQNR